MSIASLSTALALATELGMDAACRDDAAARCRVEAEGECAVCLRDGVNLAVGAFQCKHGFCGPCLAKWRGSCPCCRQDRA
jgi:hypothetical protein